MTSPTNPVLHIPAHKQMNPTAEPGQLPINEPYNAAAADSARQVCDPMYQHGVSMTGRRVSSTPDLQRIPIRTKEVAQIRNTLAQAKLTKDDNTP